jgi:hypothetical protein
MWPDPRLVAFSRFAAEFAARVFITFLLFIALACTGALVVLIWWTWRGLE